MKSFWFTLVVVVAILIKDNSCVPAIHPLSQRGILFPADDWDDCFLDEDSAQRGICKRLEECPEVLKKWDKQQIYPKTCYFIKKQQFVCCPIATSKEASTTNNALTTKKPSNIFLDIFNTQAGTFTTKPATTTRPSNIFLDSFQQSIITTTTSTTRPSNIFLDKINQNKLTSQKPPTVIPDIFYTEVPSFVRRRIETECDLQNQDKFETIDVNGPPANKFPFMAVLGWRSSSDNKIWYPCGGVLISSSFVLTAAHCADIGGENPSFVRLGDKNLTDSIEDTIKIKRIIVHPGYNVSTIYNDLALVELDQQIKNPVACLWTQQDLPITKFIALGYGHTGFDSINSNQLFTATLTAIGKSDCQNYYRIEDKLKTMDIVDTHLCAGDVDNFHNFCQGDTGGPLIMKLDKVFYVVGITSYGLGCADLPPSIYTRVSSFIDWIEPIVWPEIDVRFD